MLTTLCVLLAMPCPATSLPTVSQDTIRVEVGSKLVDARVYKPHAARVRVRLGGPDGPITSEWTNELTLGDSAGRPVMRWVTKGTRPVPNGTGTMTWELRQTYDGVSLKPLGYDSRNSIGLSTQLAMTGNRVQGKRKLPTDSVAVPVDVTLDQAGFFAGASDLLPAAMGFKEGAIILAPFWSPNATKAEMRVFTVRGKSPINVEGTEVIAWKVDEHRYSDRKLLATWYLIDKSPYMVYGEVPLPNGQVQHMSEIAIPMSK
jgi:hypothetical protein